jgi:phage protein D
LASDGTVRTPAASVIINGTSLDPEETEVLRSRQAKSDTFSAKFSLTKLTAQGFGAAFWGSASGVTAQVVASADGPGYTTIFSGQVDQVDINWEATTINVAGREGSSASLLEKRTSQKWANHTVAQVVQKIAGSHGLGVQFAQSGAAKAGKIFKDYAALADLDNDFDMLFRLADRSGASFWIDGLKKSLHWLKGGQTDTGGTGLSVTVNLGPPVSGNFLSLTTYRQLTLGRNVRTKIDSWNHKQKKVIEGSAVEPGSGGDLNYEYSMPGLVQDQANDIATNRLHQRVKHELGVRVTMPGDPAVTPEYNLQLSGTKSAWDQSYPIEEIQHRISRVDGYVMTITAKSKSSSRGAQGPLFQGLPAPVTPSSPNAGLPTPNQGPP